MSNKNKTTEFFLELFFCGGATTRVLSGDEMVYDRHLGHRNVFKSINKIGPSVIRHSTFKSTQRLGINFGVVSKAISAITMNYCLRLGLVTKSIVYT